ncbi:unnamed protein product (mitochondrion) [Plasmodiophora brassicae]|uniref:Stress-associated endoplasmic reticulum protein n=1 Tax=Plasmodiophora brassicae TaxID=37360 RepID=A0A0G4IUX8_PLABS|nr:hypothetical protein PBRA_007025 [Plasmodiophora brassicae]SPQ92984.1 unnamed protein product [Plasmodiophora brassicae]
MQDPSWPSINIVRSGEPESTIHWPSESRTRQQPLFGRATWEVGLSQSQEPRVSSSSSSSSSAFAAAAGPPMPSARKLASQKFNQNVTKRGLVKNKSKAESTDNSSPVGPVMLGFFVFVVVGSAVFQIIQSAMSGLF